MQEQAEVALWNRENKQSLWETGFVVRRGCGDSRFLQEDVMGLFEYRCGLAG